jgi:hypothetical protein
MSGPLNDTMAQDTVDRAIEFEEKYSDKVEPPEGIIF